MIVIELIAAVDSIGTLQTFYASTDAYTTKPADNPANVSFDPTVTDPGTITVNVFADGMVAGATKLDEGEIVLSNANGQYDAWKDYGFDGRAVVIRYGTKGANYPYDFSTIFTGTVDNILVNSRQIQIRLKDKQHIFDVPVLKVAYQGNNALPTGVEGNATDIKGLLKPRVYGYVRNISPPLVNTSKLTYQVSDGAVASIDAVYDRGSALTPGANFTDLTALEAASPSAGTFITCLALGLFRLGALPAGNVTADVKAGATAAARTAAQIIKALAIDAGVASSDVDGAAVAALDAANSSVVGIYLDDATTYGEAMDAIAPSVGAYFGFNPAGGFVMAVWLEPAGSSLATITEDYAGRETERRPLSDVDLPVWSVRLNHSKVYTVQSSDLAGGVTAAERGRLANEFRTEVSSDASIKTQFLLATSLELDTLLTTAADAAAEAYRLSHMLKIKRDAFEVPIPLTLLASAGIKLGACVTLQISRFGLAGGKLFRVQSVRLELARSRAVLSVWG
jgi:hypothetical protein